MIAALFVDHSVNKLRQMTGAIDTCLGKLTDAQIWERQGNQENAVGNLILHLCGNVRQWIGYGVGGEPDIRVRDAEFSAKDGLTRAQLVGRMHETVDQAIEIIGGLNAERLSERIVPQGKEVSVLEAVYQVVGHFQQHTGQIQFVTKRVTGTPLT
jgi:hypothetical protein